MTLLEQIHSGTVTQRELAAAFDSLRTVTIEDLRGTWRPDPSYAETPGGAVLLGSGWCGVRFRDSETVDPLLFPTGTCDDDTFAADLPLLLRLLGNGPQRVSDHRAAVEADGPIARIRMVHYRGALSATLVYDQVPILDYLRALDTDVLVGAVEARGMVDAPAYAVLLRN